MRRSSATENNLVVGTTRAGKGTGGVVLGIAVGLRAFSLEKFRIISGGAIVEISSCAAIFRLIESSAGALTSVRHPQLVGTLGIYITTASYSLTLRIGG